LFVHCAITIAEKVSEGAQAQAPKAAVEFDQAINYVNKIKVRLPQSC
jgi:histone deacetylase complex regulatory component SIN3